MLLILDESFNVLKSLTPDLNVPASVTIWNYLELALADKIWDLRHGFDVPGTEGAGLEGKVGLQGSHHGEGGVAVLVEQGEDGLVIVHELLVREEVVGLDVLVDKPRGEGGHLGDLVTLGRGSVKVDQGAVSLAAAAALVLAGEVDHDVGGDGAVLTVDGLHPPLDLRHVLNEVGVFDREKSH